MTEAIPLGADVVPSAYFSEVGYILPTAGH